MNTKQQVVIVGGGYAGLLSAIRLSKKTQKQPVNITLIDPKDSFTERIRLHQVATGQPHKRRLYRDMLRGTEVYFEQAWVEAIQPDDNTLSLQSSTGKKQMAYDYLVYAPGSHVNMSVVPGLKENALALDDIFTSEQVHSRIKNSKRLVICGGGLTAIEAASELAEMYPELTITMVMREVFAEAFSESGQVYLQDYFAKANVNVLDEREIIRVDADAVQLADGTSIAFDTCLWAGGFAAPKLASESGFEVNAQDRVIVDSGLRSVSHPNVYALGDAAINWQDLRMACATAMPMGAYAADHLAAEINGKPAPDAFGLGFAGWCISLGRKDGIVQRVDRYDQPIERIFTGRMGKWVKEFICKFTMWAMAIERRFPGAYMWLKVPVPVEEPEKVQQSDSVSNLEHASA